MLGLPQPGRTRGVVRVSPANRRVTDGARTRDLRDHNPRRCVAAVFRDLQIPHTQGVFSSPACQVLQDIASAVVSEWCQLVAVNLLKIHTLV